MTPARFYSALLYITHSFAQYALTRKDISLKVVLLETFNPKVRFKLIDYWAKVQLYGCR